MTSVSGQNQTQLGSGTCCLSPNPIAILFLTLLLTTSATAVLCAAMMTNNWELVRWDPNKLQKLANESQPDPIMLEWVLQDRVARILLPHGNDEDQNRHRHGGIYMVPMHGGIWTMCVDLADDDLKTLGKHGFPRVAKCLNYLAINTVEESRIDFSHESQPLHPQIRMQNLSISCSLVCLIILGCAALVGAFGICQRQLSAILVTGVMYLLAGLFALFTLMIIHFKRHKSHIVAETAYDITVDGLVAARGTARIAQGLLAARIFTTDWSLQLGWIGVGLCTITAFLWIFLSKLMRFNPLSMML